jgi:hypothetical protein
MRGSRQEPEKLKKSERFLRRSSTFHRGVHSLRPEPGQDRKNRADDKHDEAKGVPVVASMPRGQGVLEKDVLGGEKIAQLVG